MTGSIYCDRCWKSSRLSGVLAVSHRDGAGGMGKNDAGVMFVQRVSGAAHTCIGGRLKALCDISHT